MAKWYCKMAGQEIGPFSSQQLKELADAKRITPADYVRREADTEWSPAKNVKGLFTEKQVAIQVGVAVPVATSISDEEAIPVATPVKVPPMGKAVPVPPAKSVDSAKSAVKSVAKKAVVEETPDETFSFGFDTSAPSTSHASFGTKSGKGRTAGKIATKQSGTKKSVASATDVEGEVEKKPLSKKEIQKRNFMICAVATGVVILLAIVILVVASCGGSKDGTEAQNLNEETVTTPDGEAATTENSGDSEAEDSEKTVDDAEKDTTETKVGTDAEATPDDETAENSLVPKEWEEMGYLCPYEIGKGKKSCTFGSMKVFVKEIKVARLIDYDRETKVRSHKEREFCFIRIEVKNVDKEGKLLNVPGWGAKGSSAVKLFDDKGNQLKTQKISVANQADSSMQLYPEDDFTDVLVFNAPRLNNVKFLRLELPALKKGDHDGLIFIPEEYFVPKKKEKSADGADDADGADSADAETAETAEDEATGTVTKDAGEATKTKTKEPDALSDDALNDDALNDDALNDRTTFDSGMNTPEEGGLMDELEKTPPPADADMKELDAASDEANIDILNDPSLN